METRRAYKTVIKAKKKKKDRKSWKNAFRVIITKVVVMNHKTLKRQEYTVTVMKL